MTLKGKVIMGDLLGIIAPLRKFLSNSKEEITIEKGEKTVLILEAGRKYIIPDFQREIRWDEDNVALLLDDLGTGSKYLGNIILTQGRENSFSIIDGQQRITILTMILKAIYQIHGKDIDVLKPCILEIESFSGFSKLIENYFTEELMESPQICESDCLHQMNKYYDLWEYLQQNSAIQDRRSAQKLLENLEGSSVNLILNKSDNIKDGIRYFIDVNLKGKQLDVEDIFKSYLFRNDNGEEIRKKWYRFKTNIVAAEQAQIAYPLLKVLEHFFYCELFKDCKYKGLDFNEEFLLKSEFVTKEQYPQQYRKGTHLVELINSKTYMIEAFEKLNKTLEIMVEIVKSSSPTTEFNSLFSIKKGRFQTNELEIIHNILKKTLLDSSLLPKALVMKYILTTLIDGAVKEADVYKRVYGVYLLSVLFIVFENKKSKEVLLGVLKANDNEWYAEAIKQINSYFSPDKITDTRLQAQFKLGINEEEENYRFRCKSLATIFNFFAVDAQRVFVRKKKIDELRRFVTDNESFSVEHFIVSDSESHEICIKKDNDERSYKFDDTIYKKYVNSMFNYIFIPQELNSSLKNYWLPEKLKLLEGVEGEKINCEYSKMIIEKTEIIARAMTNAVHPDGVLKDDLDLFFGRDYKEAYISYAREILNDLMEHIKQS